MSSTLGRIKTALRSLTRATPKRGRAPARRHPSEASSAAYAPYLGDATTLPDMTYAPNPDGAPDPGEIVWAWVPYEEDHARGKDRPVLIIGREGNLLIGLQLTSQDHDRDQDQERRAGREWIDIGTGAWDHRGRSSEVRVNRLLRLDPAYVRREGAVLSLNRYEHVTAAVRTHYS